MKNPERGNVHHLTINKPRELSQQGRRKAQRLKGKKTQRNQFRLELCERERRVLTAVRKAEVVRWFWTVDKIKENSPASSARNVIWLYFSWYMNSKESVQSLFNCENKTYSKVKWNYLQIINKWIKNLNLFHKGNFHQKWGLDLKKA